MSMTQRALRIIDTTWAMYCIPATASETIDVDALPGSVTAAIGERFPGATVRGVARDLRNGCSTYRIRLQLGERICAIRTSVGGGIIAIAE